MKVLILSDAQVEMLLPMQQCIALMSEALQALARGEMHQPLRITVRPPDAASMMGLMPAYRKDVAYALKALCLFPDNPNRGMDTHQGVVMLSSGETGETLALMNASRLTAIRTAAVSAVATKLLAREDACTLAIIGAGVQARSHLSALASVRTLRRARIASRNMERARTLACEAEASYSFPVEAAASVEEALLDADLIVTATTSREPVLKREWIAAGAHLNAVGSCSPGAREIDTATIAESSLFVDKRESTFNEAGDYLLALREGEIGPEHIRAEIGEVLTGMRPGRTSPDEITLFKSLGLAAEDLAAAEYLYQVARQKGIGTWVEF